MKFYMQQNSYSFYDTSHVKQLLHWISTASKEVCGGWASPATYKFCNKVEFDCNTTDDTYYDDYIMIWSRRLATTDLMTLKSEITSKPWNPYKWILLNKYKIKLGFYKIPDKELIISDF